MFICEKIGIIAFQVENTDHAFERVAEGNSHLRPCAGVSVCIEFDLAHITAPERLPGANDMTGDPPAEWLQQAAVSLLDQLAVVPAGLEL